MVSTVAVTLAGAEGAESLPSDDEHATITANDTAAMNPFQIFTGYDADDTGGPLRKWLRGRAVGAGKPVTGGLRL